MQSLLRFLARLGPIFLFLLLEGICLYLIVSFNSDQNRIFLSSANRITGFISETRARVSAYTRLNRDNQQLLEEIIALRKKLGNAYYDNTLSIDTALADSSALPLYAYISAQVVNNSISLENNFLTLNKGANHGIAPHMGVISSEGIVGIVRGVSPHYARVMSVLHSQTRITAEVRNKGYFGSLVWRGADPRYMFLDDVPKHHFIELGDTIQTSPLSHIFPPEIEIGVIEDFFVPEGNSDYEIKVRLNNDLGRLRHVLVINNLMSQEIEELEEQAEYE